MAKLYFYYSAMNAGKSTTLLQSSYNYKERGMQTFLFAPRIDTRFGSPMVSSRIGLKEEAIAFGLKAVMVFFDIDESQELAPIEDSLSKIENVNSMQVVDMRRAFG